MFRLIAVLGGLSLVTDLGAGSPPEESLRRCLVAARFARALGCDDAEVRDVLYTALLQHLGCTAYSHESARLWGDDVAVNRLGTLTYFADPRDPLRTFLPGMVERTGRGRVRTFATGMVLGPRDGTRHHVATCEVARAAAGRLGLPGRVQESLYQTTSWWNGGGFPTLAGEAISRVARIMHVAFTAVLFDLHAGPDAALAEVDRRAGGYLEPRLAAAFRAAGADVLRADDDLDPYEQLLDAEPDPVRWVDAPEVDEVAATFGDLVDLKSPVMHGHSAGVAELAATAAGHLGLDPATIRNLRLAGFLHDLGRVGVPSRLWDKPRGLTAADWDQVRLHAYHSERILVKVPALDDVAVLAGRHHERCDGSGYHHGVTATHLTMPARVLAAADIHQALLSERPYRRALTRPEAAGEMHGQARDGRLDGDAVAAVLGAGGHRTGARRARPSGLTERQVEVLRLLSSGMTNRQIGNRLHISPRTAERHVQDLYLKIGCSSRAAAALFAMEHGLVDEPG